MNGKELSELAGVGRGLGASKACVGFVCQIPNCQKVLLSNSFASFLFPFRFSTLFGALKTGGKKWIVCLYRLILQRVIIPKKITLIDVKDIFPACIFLPQVFLVDCLLILCLLPGLHLYPYVWWFRRHGQGLHKF